MTGKGRYLAGVLFLCALFLLTFGTLAAGHPATRALAVAPPDPAPPDAVASADAVASTGRGPATSPQVPDNVSSIAGSTVTTAGCYKAASTQTLCFAVTNGTPDGEWLDRVRLTFPTMLGAWTVACSSQDPTDSNGSPVGFTCSAAGNEVYYNDTDIETPANIGEVSRGATWGFCVDVTVPGGYTGPRYVPWGLSGDEQLGSTLPHDVSGSTEIEMCTPLMLTPSSAAIQGCNGLAATQDFTLWNNTGSPGTFNLNYAVPSGNASFTGPTSAVLGAGGVMSFTVSLTPDQCVAAGKTVVASLTASGNGESDSSTLVETVGDFKGFELENASPAPTMDNVVAWAVPLPGYDSNWHTGPI